MLQLLVLPFLAAVVTANPVPGGSSFGGMYKMETMGDDSIYAFNMGQQAQGKLDLFHQPLPFSNRLLTPFHY